MSKLKFFKNVIERNMLSHLYLLVGDRETNKIDLAYEVSNLILERYDNNENLLETIKSNKHTQVHYIRPQGQSIRKEQILELQNEFSKTSLIDAPRIYIIENVDVISVSAANSLLKFLEEPENDNIYGLLTTENLQGVLPTIISRSQTIRVLPEKTNDVYSFLLENGYDEFLAENVSSLTNDYDEALRVLEDDHYVLILEFVKDFFVNFNNKKFDNLIEVNKRLSHFIFERDKYLLLLELMLKNYSKLFKNKLIDDKYTSTSFRKINKDIELIKKEIIKQSYNININLSLDVLMLKLKK